MRAACRATGNRILHAAGDDLRNRRGARRFCVGIAGILCRDHVDADWQRSALENSDAGTHRARAEELAVVQQLHGAAGSAVGIDAHIKSDCRAGYGVQIGGGQ